MGQKPLSDFLNDLGAGARTELRTPVTVDEVDAFPDIDKLPLESRRWSKIKDVVVVAADLKGSTKLGFDKHAQTSARLYEAVTGSMVAIVYAFDPAFVAIQGDGIFAIFHGEGRHERALCAGITLKTFSEFQLLPAISDNRGISLGETFPDTGLKVGLASGIVVVKKVGIRVINEPVWAGKPVNWAVKCAQAAEAHQLIATRSVFDRFRENQYVFFSCGCRAEPKPHWTEKQVEKLPDSDAECMMLRSQWCSNCGDDFCSAILAGLKRRDDLKGAA